MQELAQPYTLSLLSVALLVLVVTAQNFHSSFVNLVQRSGQNGVPVEGNHDDQHWRLYRAHCNSLENFSIFAAAVFAAILLGASAFLLNLLAVIHVAARIAHWVIYVKGIGPVANGPRSLAFAVGFFSTALIALLAVFAAIF